MLEELTAHLRRDWEARYPDLPRPRGLHYLAASGSLEGGTLTLLVFADGARQPWCVVKVHRNAEQRDLADNEHRLLGGLVARGEFFRRSVPHVLFCGQVGGVAVVVQSVVEGTMMRARLTGDDTPDLPTAHGNLQLALQWLIECHRATRQDGGVHGEDWRVLARGLVDEFVAIAGISADEEVYLGELRAEIESWPTDAVPLCVRHGDFCCHNILVSRRGGAPAIGVIDWTFGRPAALPLHDLIFFVTMYGLGLRRASGPEALERFFAYSFLGDNAYHALVEEWIARYCQALAIDPALTRTLVALAIVEQALLEYRRTARTLRRGELPGFTVHLATAEGRPYREAARAQLWSRFFRLFARGGEAFPA